MLCLAIIATATTTLFAQNPTQDCGIIIFGNLIDLGNDNYTVDVQYQGVYNVDVDGIDIVLDFGEDAGVSFNTGATLTDPNMLQGLFPSMLPGNKVRLAGSPLGDDALFSSGIIATIHFSLDTDGCTNMTLDLAPTDANGGFRGISYSDGLDCPSNIIGSNRLATCNADLTISGSVLPILGNADLGDRRIEAYNVNGLERVEGFTVLNDYSLLLLEEFGGKNVEARVELENEELFPPSPDLECGVDVSDLIRTRQFLLNIITFEEPWMYLAADMNNSGTIRVSDITAMTRALLNMDDAAAVPYSWVYPTQQDLDIIQDQIDADETVIPIYTGTHTFPNLGEDKIGVNFWAIKRGDTDGNCYVYDNATGPGDPEPDITSNHEVTVQDIGLNDGEEVVVPLNINGLTKESILTLALNFDVNDLDIIGIENNSKEVTAGTYDIDAQNGILNFIWVPDDSGSNVYPTPNGGADFNLRIRANRNLTSITESLGLTSDKVENEKYNLGGDKSGGTLSREPLSLKWVKKPSSASSVQSDAFEVVAVNPVTQDFGFWINSPINQNITIRIMGINGASIQTQRFDLTNGRQRVLFTSSASLPAGNYSYEIIGQNNILTAGIITKR